MTDELIDNGYTYDEAEYIAENAQDLKFITTKMRTGEFPYERYGNGKGVHIDMDNVVDPQDRYAVNNMLLPHWNEFAAALKHFTPMRSNNITSGVSTLLADFLATNPRMKELHLEHNRLNDSDAALIANALRSNTTLGSLQLYGNSFTDVGAESLRLALYDESSLNATADSNHTCTVYIRIWGAINDHNSHEQGQISRGWKNYSILSTRNETMSNVRHFGNIDVKLLPNVLDAVQKMQQMCMIPKRTPCRLCMK